MEEECFEDIWHPERAQYVMHCQPVYWRVLSFFYDTDVRSSQPGSGLVGPSEGN
jgi:hypothetical protein